ncbi:uncharacterized protein CDAR_277641 [Caerostris darwini]|uniref:Uncharacterized protein n=1 Tax=Caerostris darwini TaxID=1538125 RepID=A0AAV4QIN9_9ARAC|nr:uncharacterized protein CDAR_277641 [Caerostris darwini]
MSFTVQPGIVIGAGGMGMGEYRGQSMPSQTPLKKDTDDMPDGEEKGPDIIPANIINRAYYTEDPKESSPSGSTIATRRWPETPPRESIEASLTSTYRKPNYFDDRYSFP